MRLIRSTRVLISAVVCATFLTAQNSGRIYDSSTEITIKGKVENVTEPGRGRLSGLHLFLQGDSGATEVALGPSTFVKNQGFSFAKEDFVEVTGSKITVNSRIYIVAREVVKDGKILVLRDKNGIPKWGGRKARWNPAY